MSSGPLRCYAVALGLVALAALPLSVSAETACDRACLTRVADAWFTAMVAHDPGKVLTLAYPDGTRGTRDMATQRQLDMAAAHVIKVCDRKIHEIEATGAVLPFNSKNGWNEFLR